MTERLFEPDVVQCPFPRYRELQEQGPVYKVPDDDLYLVLGYDDCVEVLTNPDVYSSKAGPGLRQRQAPAARAVLSQGHRIVRTLLTNDPPSHRRYRRIVASAFTPRRLGALALDVTDTVAALVDTIEKVEQVDFVRDFAQPLPLIVIADFLGVPKDDLAIFKRWSDDAAEVLGGTLSEQRQIEVNTSLQELLQYFAERTEDRRGTPTSDFLGALVEADEGRLTTEEIIAIAYVVLVAGNETTVNLVSSVLLMLLQEPHLMASVRADRSLIPSAIEEALRLQSPIQGFPRVATVDSEINGVPVPAGSRVMVMIGAANRDSAQFENPDEVNLASGPAAHVSFGKGIHFCVGAALSRLEAGIALNALLDRFGSIQLTDPDFEPRYADNAILRSLLTLPVTLRP
ncbi:cytochrome P450 [Nocardia sp. NBC_00565]|uniref:cytochrome P450 n=1 Tax=Nocardia sp. NBC_00565 TaxID=2975993 RepID=UPI002E8179FD|nr:cytochrome P450 [Nocardia sp. NBC_00565]WUC06768.1 cytochrome P450 [Nocardia sp. NBC_00565]